MSLMRFSLSLVCLALMVPNPGRADSLSREMYLERSQSEYLRGEFSAGSYSVVYVKDRGEYFAFDRDLGFVYRLFGENWLSRSLLNMPEGDLKVLDISPRSGVTVLRHIELGILIYDPFTQIGSPLYLGDDVFDAKFGGNDDELILLTDVGLDRLVLSTGARSGLVDLTDDLRYLVGNKLQVAATGDFATVTLYTSRFSESQLVDLREGSSQALTLPYVGALVWFSPDGQRLYTFGNGEYGEGFFFKAREYDLNTGAFLREMEFMPDPLSDTIIYYGHNLTPLFSPDSKSVALVAENKVMIVDLEEWSLKSMIECPGDYYAERGFLSNDARSLSFFGPSEIRWDFELVTGNSIPLIGGFSEPSEWEISFETKAGSWYQVEQSVDLESWFLPLERFEGLGSEKSLSLDILGSDAVFARVLEFSIE